MYVLSSGIHNALFPESRAPLGKASTVSARVELQRLPCEEALHPAEAGRVRGVVEGLTLVQRSIDQDHLGLGKTTNVKGKGQSIKRFLENQNLEETETTQESKRKLIKKKKTIMLTS